MIQLGKEMGSRLRDAAPYATEDRPYPAWVIDQGELQSPTASQHRKSAWTISMPIALPYLPADRPVHCRTNANTC